MDLWVSVPIAVGIAGLTEAIKQALDKAYHKYIPLGLVVVGPAAGAGISLVMGGTWQEGVIAGIIATTGAAFGYDFIHGLRKGMREPE